MKRLTKYAHTRMKRLAAALENYHQFQEADSLHRIRVEIKKLRAVVQAVAFADRQVDIRKAFRPIQKIFRKSGQIRHPAVTRELILVYGIDGVPLSSVADLREDQDSFRADVPFYITHVQKFDRKLAKWLQNISAKDLVAFVRKREKSIKPVFVPAFKPTRLHQARKRIKQVFYLSGLVACIKPKDRKIYSRLEKAIGSLHDKEIVLEFLATLPGATDPSSVARLRRSCSEERKSIRAMAVHFYR